MKRLLVSALLVILFVSLSLTPSRASVVWSDNFDDGNLDEWTISGCKHYSIKNMVPVKGNATAADKNLHATGNYYGQTWYTYVTRPTMVSSGTWSFDAYLPEDRAEENRIFPLVIDFMDKSAIAKEDWLDWHGYEISVTITGSIYLSRGDGGEWGGDSYKSSLPFHPSGWYHVDVTRDTNGRWQFYMNGTLRLEATDNKYPTFPYFGFYLQPGALPTGTIIDNIVVSDTIYVPPGSLKVTVKDSTGNALSGVAVSSTKQPSGQTTISGVTGTNGTVTFKGLAIGNYTLQGSKGGYVSGSAQGAIASGARTELSATLQVQPASGISAFPFESVVVSLLLCAAWYWLYARRMRFRGA